MHQGQLVFAQVMQALPIKAFSRFVTAHGAHHKVKDFSCLDQLYVMAYGQLTARESLRDIEANLRSERAHWFHMGLRCKQISRNTISNANKARPWQVFADLAQHLIATARTLYANEPHIQALAPVRGASVYALDSTTIDLCLSLFAWAPFRQTKAAVKVHVLLDVRTQIPSFVHITDGKTHDVRTLDTLAKQGLIGAGSFYVVDKAYVDFKRLFMLETHKAYFVTRAKINLQAALVKPRKFKEATGVTADEIVQLTGMLTAKHYPIALRKVSFIDPETGKALVFLTNNLRLPAQTICALYKQRWQPERTDTLIHHCDRGTQYVSIVYTERLAQAGIKPSVGSRGDSYDNALAETINGLYKAELIHRRAPWKTKEALELAPLEWVAWFNHHRLLSSIGYIPPTEAQVNYYRQLAGTSETVVST